MYRLITLPSGAGRAAGELLLLAPLLKDMLVEVEDGAIAVALVGMRLLASSKDRERVSLANEGSGSTAPRQVWEEEVAELFVKVVRMKRRSRSQCRRLSPKAADAQVISVCGDKSLLEKGLG